LLSRLKEAAEKGHEPATSVRREQQGLKRMRKKARFGVKSAESVFPGLKPYRFCWLYAGVETPASLRTEFFRSL
jgi:hypothetical protein